MKRLNCIVRIIILIYLLASTNSNLPNHQITLKQQQQQIEAEMECSCDPHPAPCPCRREPTRDHTGELAGPPIVATPEIISCGEAGCFQQEPPPLDHVELEIVDLLPHPPKNSTN